MRIPLLIAALSFAASVPAFQSYQGSRFGHVDISGIDKAWGITRSGTGYFVVGTADDSSCCDTNGTTIGNLLVPNSSFSFSIMAWTGRLFGDFALESSRLIWSDVSSRFASRMHLNSGSTPRSSRFPLAAKPF